MGPHRTLTTTPTLTSSAASQQRHNTAHGFYKVFALAIVLAIWAVPSMAASWTVISTADDGTPGTLRSVIAAAASGDTINIAATGTITLDCTAGVLDISKNLTISGPGATHLAISGNNACGVFQVDLGVTASISGVTIENGLTGTFGAGISNLGTLNVGNSAFSGNAAIFGGGIFSSGTATVTNSTFSGNAATFGGGIFTEGTAAVTNSTFSGNAVTYGGGIYNLATATVTNSTFSANSASDSGGGFFNYFQATATVTNSTFSGNSAVHGGGIYNFTSATLTVKNTLLANSSSGGNCFNDGVLSSGHYNLSDDDSCSAYFIQSGDLNNTAAGLDPNGLQNNGGPTKTVALLSTSPAVDAIPVSPTNYCTLVDGTTPVSADQRGVSRPQGTACDIGALELAESFSAFAAKLEIVKGGLLPGFELNSAFTLGAASNGINPHTEPVTLTVGSYTVTIPAGKFKRLIHGAKRGGYVYGGRIHGVALLVEIAPMKTANSYRFAAVAIPVIPARSNPVKVTITIGSDSGTTSVTAKFH